MLEHGYDLSLQSALEYMPRQGDFHVRIQVTMDGKEVVFKVRKSDRGNGSLLSLSVYHSGFEDVPAAKGEITQLMTGILDAGLTLV